MPTLKNGTRFYSLRSMSPFSGTVQVVEQAESRAFSTDGINWEIQVLAESINSFWSMPDTESSDRQFYRYAIWSAHEGLVHLRVNPILDIGKLQQAGGQLLNELKIIHDKVPLPQEDAYELWLLDQDDQLPLALVDTSIDEPTAKTTPSPWVALPKQQNNAHLKNAMLIEQQVRRRNGQGRAAQWFVRQSDGSGNGLNGKMSSHLEGRELSKESFPELLLQEQWSDPNAQQLVDDYLNWLAPKLLTLQHLSPSTRTRLELVAAKNPLLMETLHLIYPEIIDQDNFTSVRVQAKLMRATKSNSAVK